MSTRPSRQLILHELGHGLPGLLLGGETFTIEREADGWWRTTVDWGGLHPGEFETMCTHLGGHIIEGRCSSPEDELLMAACPADIRSKVIAYIEQHVLPLLITLTDARLDRIADLMERDGRVTFGGRRLQHPTSGPLQ